jgi:bacillithiol biosynthesis deacetylase BshB1
MEDALKLDILAFAAHPDDAELSCGGTLLLHQALGYRTGIVDLTQGELGTRGDADTRMAEAAAAARILNLSHRQNLGMADGFFINDRDHQLAIIRTIRNLRPEIVLANAVRDRHTDHGKAAELTAQACFLSGLSRIETVDDAGRPQKAWRPKHVYHYIQDRHIAPDLVVDISAHWEQKKAAILAYGSQFWTPDASGPQTPISGEDFLLFLEGRSREMGRIIGVPFGEGFTSARPPGTTNLFHLI